jgi:hypothetical protein
MPSSFSSGYSSTQAELLSNRDPDVVKQKPRLSTRSLALRERSSSLRNRVLADIWIS